MRARALAVLLACVAAGCGGTTVERIGRAVPAAPQSPDCGEEEWVRLPLRLTFDPESDVLDAEQHPILDELIAGIVRPRHDVRRVRVEGHPEACARGGRATMELAHRRATGVAGLLVARGLAREHIETVGYGSMRRKNENHVCRPDPRDHRTSGRVEFTLLVCTSRDQPVAR